MARASRRHPSERRARRSFWLLLLVAVLAAGALSASIGAEPGALTGLRLGASGLVLVVALALAARVMVALEHSRRLSRKRPTRARHGPV